MAHLDLEKCSVIRNIIKKYSSLFAKDAFDIGSVKNYEAHITLSEDSYILKKQYRCSYEDLAKIKRQVAELLQQVAELLCHNTIWESSSPFASPEKTR